MNFRSIRLIVSLATLVALLACGGADGVAPLTTITRSSDSTLLAGLYASGPVAGGYISRDLISANASAEVNEVSWVSLVPGIIPDGTSAAISNLRTTQRVTASIVDGGFDPQAIPASLGDTIQVSVSRVGKPDVAALLSISARPAPRIVRTRPPRGQTDAPLNTIITLVFSEPLEPVSVNSSSVTLATAGSPVAGEVRILPGPGYIVEFTPSALLAPLTTYSLTVGGVANLSGTPLVAPTSITFTTSTSTSPDSVIAPRGQAAREIPVNSSFFAHGPISVSGYPLPVPVTWRNTDPSVATVEPFGTDSGEATVTGIRPGTTVIEGSALGVTVTIAVTVLAPAPVSAVSPVTMDFRMFEWHFNPASNFWHYSPQIVLVDTTGSGGSAIVGVSFDLPFPNQGVVRSINCVMDRAVGSDPLEVFHAETGGFELLMNFNNGQRVSGSEAVAHVILRIPGPAAMTIDVRGPILPGSFPPTYTGAAFADVLSCG